MELFDGFCCLPLFDVMWDHLGILISYDFFMSRKKQFNKQDLGETVRHLRHAPTDLPSSVNADMDLRFASLHATLVIFATMLCSSSCDSFLFHCYHRRYVHDVYILYICV